MRRQSVAELLSGVDVFVAAVEAGGFAAAGERLHLTRSAVAKAIARIEERLDVRLFHRTTRTLGLTEDGQTYYERCVRALEELRAGEAALESGRREAAGRLRVSAPVLFGRYCVAPVLAKVAAQHPKLELELSFSDRPVDLIEDGFDLAIRNGNIGIVYGGAGHIRTWEFSAGGRKTLVEVTPPSRLRFDNVEAIADAAEAG